MRLKSNKIVESALGNTITFYWKVALSTIIIYDDMLKEHMDIINGKLEYDYFVMNSLEQTSKIYPESYEIKNTVKCDIRIDIIVFQQTMLISMVNRAKKKITFLSSS